MTMRWLTISICVLAFVNATWADAGLPFFRGNVNVDVRFVNLSDFPDFDFYLKSSDISGGNEPRGLKKITASSSAHLFGRGGLGFAFLVAVPRGQPLPTPEELRDQPDRQEVPGHVAIRTPLGSDGFLSKADNGGEIIYRVAIDGETLAVEVSEARLPPKIWRWVALGFLVAVVLIFLLAVGLGFMIRQIKRNAPSLPDKS